MWVTPKGLKLAKMPGGRNNQNRVPKDMQTLSFEVSAKHGGFHVVPTQNIIPGAIYEVVMEDRREDALQNLSPTVVAEIRSNFDAYDTDQDGGVSREEVETKVKERSEQRKVKIEEQFQTFLQESPDRKEEAKHMLNDSMSKLQEAEQTLLDLFAKADIDGNGVLSWKEYLLAEA